MVLFLSPKKFRSGNTLLKETTDQNRELKAANEITMKLKDSANGIFIGDDENSSGNIGEANVGQTTEPMQYSQLASNKDDNDRTSVRNGASAENGQLLGRNPISAPAANKHANAENSLENGALAGNGQQLSRETASPAAKKDAKAENSVKNVGLVGAGPQLMSKTEAARQRQQQSATDGSKNLILASTDLKLASPMRPFQVLNSTNEIRQNETNPNKINAARQQPVAGSSELNLQSLAKTQSDLKNSTRNGFTEYEKNISRLSESGISDANAPKYYATNASNNKIASNYSTSDNASKTILQLNLATDSTATATGENSTSNGTSENTENSTDENSYASSNSEGTEDLKNDESVAYISNAESATDAAISDDDFENANGTMLTNNSSSNSDDFENAEEDADATTERTSTEREVLVVNDKYEEIVPDYNELDVNGQHVNSKQLLVLFGKLSITSSRKQLRYL
jgi:hypothetical protein